MFAGSAVCRQCKERPIKPRTAAMHMGLCKQCWHELPHDPAIECKECRLSLPTKGVAAGSGLCRACFQKMPRAHNPDLDCSQCRMPRPSKGHDKLVKSGLCRNCYRRQPKNEQLDSWTDFIRSNYPSTQLTRSTLFLGNLPHDCTNKEVQTWLEEMIPKDTGYKRFPVIHSGHHVYEKCFKTFVFVQFENAKDALALKLKIEEEGKWQGRRIPARPAVLQEWHPADQRTLQAARRAPRHERFREDRSSSTNSNSRSRAGSINSRRRDRSTSSSEHSRFQKRRSYSRSSRSSDSP